MIQKAIKVLTLGFFISMITGFVVYRMGYFDSSTPSNALQTSPNGGELNNANQVSDSIQTPEIKPPSNNAIMPSSKSITPAFDLKKYQEKKAKEHRMSSSKSVILTDFNLEVEDVKEHYVQPSKSKQTIDLKKIEAKKEKELRMYSSKSMTFPISIKSPSNQIPETYRQAFFNEQSKTRSTDSTPEKERHTDSNAMTKLRLNQIDSNDEPSTEVEKPKGIYWGMIGLGVLGILFVGIGSIVYFKRKSE